MFPWNKQFPFNHSEFTKQFQEMNPKEIENYIQTVMSSIFGNDFSKNFPFQGEMQNNQSKNLPGQTAPEIFETNDYIYVKLAVNSSEINSLKIQHTTTQLMLINNQNEDNSPLTFMLPAPVKRKGTKARYIDGFIEIQLIKLKEHSITEVEISK